MNENERETIYLKIFQATEATLKELNSDVEYLTPQQTDLYRNKLSALYALLSDELARLEQEKAQRWFNIKVFDDNGVPEPIHKRDKPLSDKMTDTCYDITDNGQRRIELKFRLKAMEKVISALAGRLHRMNQEAKNNF